jgi:hypothetical protein
MPKSLLLLLFTCFSATLFAQEFGAYGIKGGMTLGFQKWNSNAPGDVLFLPLGNGSFITEIYNGRSALSLEFGYHERGSALIQRAFRYADPNNPSIIVDYPARTLQRKFSNIVFQPAFKQLYDVGSGWNAYYLFGARLEYTIKDTIPYAYNPPVDVHIGLNRFNYGISVGGGAERRLGNSPIMMQIEFQAQPDFSAQIQIPPLVYYDIYSRSNYVSDAQKVNNITFELTLGFKFADYPEEESD